MFFLCFKKFVNNGMLRFSGGIENRRKFRTLSNKDASVCMILVVSCVNAYAFKTGHHTQDWQRATEMRRVCYGNIVPTLRYRTFGVTCVGHYRRFQCVTTELMVY